MIVRRWAIILLNTTFARLTTKPSCHTDLMATLKKGRLGRKGKESYMAYMKHNNYEEKYKLKLIGPVRALLKARRAFLEGPQGPRIEHEGA